MTARELAALERLTRKFRDHYSWDRREKPGGRLEHAPARMLEAIRFVKQEGGFYRDPSMRTVHVVETRVSWPEEQTA